MRLLPFFALVAAAPLVAQTPASDQYMARALRVLRAHPVIDGHNDLPWRIREDTVHPHDVEAYDLRKRTPGMTDLARIKARTRRRAVLVDLHPRRARRSAYTIQGRRLEHARLRARAARADRHRAPHDREVSASFKWALTADAVRANFKRGNDRRRCSASRAATRSRIRWRCCARTTTSARAT